ncbi:hypothetical protein ACFFWC_20275 [Plantactinospora siamensis]|uniref:Serine protease n=1 Tax=Plantactinospora siamensis TaxID=555372 RepID=A0ABV6P518_9ACTN
MTVDDERLIAIKARAAAEFLTRPDVTAVGLGGRERNGRPTGEIVLKVFVVRKRPLAELAAGEALPSEFEGVGVDVSQLAPSEPDTDPDGEVDDGPEQPVGSARVPRGAGDDDKYRPLIGGVQVQTAHRNAGTGTLGAILVHQTDPAQVFALTNFHVVDSGSEDAEAGVTRVGQPTNFASSTRCCSHQFGTFRAGARDAVRDAAAVRLDPGTQWMAEIVDVGVVAGTHTITVAEAATLTYSVRKRGAKTRLTGGVVEAINADHTSGEITRHNVIIVRPRFNPAVPDDQITYFADHGDSGAVVLNDDNEVVGLHFAGSVDEDLGIRKGIELPIDVILGAFASDDGLPLALATADDTGVVQTVPGATLRVPEELAPALSTPEPGVRVLAPPGTHLLPGVVGPSEDLLAAVRARLDTTPRGRALVRLWVEHQAELVRLVNEHRRVAVVWHRCGGPALVQTLIRMAGRPDLRLPLTVNGQPLSDCLGRIHDAFAAQGSPPLRAALRAARDALPDLAGRTYPEIVAALDGPAPVATAAAPASVVAAAGGGERR